MSKLDNKVVIVTGGGRGIGKGIAVKLAKEGAKVIVTSRTEEEINEVANEIKGIAIKCDVSKEAEVKNVINEIIKRFGRIDILVNNAGVGCWGNVVDTKIEEFDEVMNVNVRGVFLFTRFVLPHMIKNKDGFIINIASIAGKRGSPGLASYCASKFAVVGFSEALFQEVREDGIRVCCICPGSVDTKLHTAEERDWMLKPEDIAKAVYDVITQDKRSMVSEVVIRPSVPK